MLDQMLMDRFRIVKQIGFGAFGETFLAEDTHKRLNNQSSSQCVVKRLITQTDPAHIAITRQMFEREASKLDDLNHSGIPKLIAYFEDNGQFYLVQEFIDGNPLSDEINHTVKWSEARTRELLREVLEILAYVHSHGSIHRDLKPSNIMRRRANDKIVMIDFGAVREVQQNQTNVAVGLASGTIAIGTLGYMPAEQTQGRPCFASDIYAVGCMAIEALTAEAPYGHGFEQDAETGEFKWRHKAQVSDDFVEYIDKMVRYDFRQRYRNAEQALTALQSLKPLVQKTTIVIQPDVNRTLPAPAGAKIIEPTQVIQPHQLIEPTEKLISPLESSSFPTIAINPVAHQELKATSETQSETIRLGSPHREISKIVDIQKTKVVMTLIVLMGIVSVVAFANWNKVFPNKKIEPISSSLNSPINAAVDGSDKKIQSSPSPLNSPVNAVVDGSDKKIQSSPSPLNPPINAAVDGSDKKIQSSPSPLNPPINAAVDESDKKIQSSPSSVTSTAINPIWKMMGTAVTGERVYVDISSIQKSGKETKFIYRIGDELVDASADCQSNQWYASKYGWNSPQSNATQEMLQYVCK